LAVAHTPPKVGRGRLGSFAQQRGREGDIRFTAQQRRENRTPRVHCPEQFDFLSDPSRPRGIGGAEDNEGARTRNRLLYCLAKVAARGQILAIAEDWTDPACWLAQLRHAIDEPLRDSIRFELPLQSTRSGGIRMTITDEGTEEFSRVRSVDRLPSTPAFHADAPPAPPKLTHSKERD
jgi:hypothetical protein